MYRLSVLVFVPALCAFAPIPPSRPVTDPDRAIQQFDYHACSTAAPDRTVVADSKLRLVSRLRGLHARLTARGETAEASVVRDYLALVESVDADRPLGPVKPADLLKKASGEGKYQHLLHVLHVPGDRSLYGQFQDFGYWNGTFYGGKSDLQAGHWVYIHPRWFIWKEGPARLP